MRRLLLAMMISAAWPAMAELQPRGSDMAYDPQTNLTWLLNPRAARGSAFDDGYARDDGRLTFEAASAWAAQLVVQLNQRALVDWALPPAITTGVVAQDSIVWLAGAVTRPPLPVDSMSYLSLEGWIVRDLSGQVPWPPLVAPAYSFTHGVSGLAWSQTEGYAFAVHAGDVAAVPEASTLAMMLLGMAVVGSAARAARGRSGRAGL